MIHLELHPRITGVPPKPVSTRMPVTRSVPGLLQQKLPTLTPNTPVLIQAGTGAGKTTAISESAVSFSIENDLKIWFVSSRAAINGQFKIRLAKQLGINEVLTDYTPEGLRRLEDIGPVKIITYHKLWSILNTTPSEAQDVGILVVDEVHALALDATFVPFTGQLLERIPRAFGRALRIYLSATPEPILTALARAEGCHPIRLYHRPADYQQFRLHLYESHSDVIDHLNNLPLKERALVFVPSIAEGKVMQDKLKVSSQLVTAKTKETDPELWSKLLDQGHLDCQVLLATSTLDAGVSLMDPNLKHIVCSGLDPAAVLQQAGRKRLKSGERVNIYLWNPSRQQIGHLLQRSVEALGNLRLNRDEPHRFLQECILDDEFPQARHMSAVERDLSIKVNPLSIDYYEREIDRLERLLSSGKARPAENFWGNVFKRPVKRPATKFEKLGKGDDQRSQTELQEFLVGASEHPLTTETQKSQFASTLKWLYTDAFGSRKNDRADRIWGLATCRNVLASLNWGYFITSMDGSWILRRQGDKSAD